MIYCMFFVFELDKVSDVLIDILYKKYNLNLFMWVFVLYMSKYVSKI